MSDQIIVQIAKGWNDITMVQLVRAPNVPEDDIGIMQFKCDSAHLPSWTQPGGIEQHGQTLLASLMNSHERVRDALQHALTLASGEACPIYLHLKALPESEIFCWEALCHQTKGFMALDRRWQVARIAGSPQFGPRQAEAYEPPLRIVAVLSALGRDATPEWEGLYNAVTRARKDGLPIALHVATGHEELQDHIRELARTDNGLTQFELGSLMDLIGEVDEFRPHLVHFFSHGSTTVGKPRLHLATLNDTDTSSIELTLDDLLASPAVRGSWLTVLNCCESSAACKDIHSLTYSLVAGGVNAAIGMKQAVNELDAFEFSSRLYPALLDTLQQHLTPLTDAGEATVDFAHALWAPRRALHARYAGTKSPQWTLPVLYAQQDLLRVRRATPQAPAAKAHTRTVDELLAMLGSLAPEKRQLFLDELQAVRSGN